MIHAANKWRLSAAGSVCAALKFLGSAAAGGFNPLRSDVDLLVQFYETGADPLDEYFGLKAQLEVVLQRFIDLLVAGTVRNPYVLGHVNASRQLVYAA